MVPIFADGFKSTRFSPFIQSYMNQDFLADGCEVAVFEIVYDKSDLRLYGVRLFDRDGVIRINAGWTNCMNQDIRIHRVHLDPGERLIGALSRYSASTGYTSELSNISASCTDFQFIIGRKLN